MSSPPAILHACLDFWQPHTEIDETVKNKKKTQRYRYLFSNRMTIQVQFQIMYFYKSVIYCMLQLKYYEALIHNLSRSKALKSQQVEC